MNISGNNTVISFSGSISGLAAVLQRVASVETLGYGGQGTAVCRINGVGNPAVQGQCLGEKSGKYWSYWRGTGRDQVLVLGYRSRWDVGVRRRGRGLEFGNGAPPFSSFCAVAGRAPPPPPPPPPPQPAPVAAPAPAAAPVLTAPAAVAPSGGGAAAPPAGVGRRQATRRAAAGRPERLGRDVGGYPRRRQRRVRDHVDDQLARNGSRTQPRGRSGLSDIRADDDRRTPIVAAGVVALGVGGFLIRSSRRSTPG